jgi:hypothetical protein
MKKTKHELGFPIWLVAHDYRRPSFRILEPVCIVASIFHLDDDLPGMAHTFDAILIGFSRSAVNIR